MIYYSPQTQSRNSRCGTMELAASLQHQDEDSIPRGRLQLRLGSHPWLPLTSICQGAEKKKKKFTKHNHQREEVHEAKSKGIRHKLPRAVSQGSLPGCTLSLQHGAVTTRAECPVPGKLISDSRFFLGTGHMDTLCLARTTLIG